MVQLPNLKNSMVSFYLDLTLAHTQITNLTWIEYDYLVSHSKKLHTQFEEQNA